ncbi:MAG: PIG-L family deacetylase [Endozoicomonadaceae bacterium]|nr:PIG-L family deacetylase [Endozoicomonadaceae bacterium]
MKHNSTHNPSAYRKKRLFCELFAMVIILLVGLFFIRYYLVLSLLPLFYLLHEILFADHIFYHPRQDYQYTFKADHQHDVLLVNRKIQPLTIKKTADDEKEQIITWLLSFILSPKISGHICDPYVEIRCGTYKNSQYFERGAAGKRYLDLSAAIGSDPENISKLSLHFHHCSAKKQTAVLLKFLSPDITKKRILIIAPHADDAEIAAFGLYSQSDDTHIVTLTAGETEVKDYLSVCANPEEASRFKGRLRAMDSIAVPLWGGIPQERCIQLGYFCKQLPVMCSMPETAVKSPNANISDTRFFRKYNRYKLTSDTTGKATWNNLILDLTEIIERIRPEIILTPQPDLDPHPDHYYGTKAVDQALTTTDCQPEMILYYANHYKTTDRFPFGPEHTIASLPPHFGAPPNISTVVSLPLTSQQQRDKVFALKMMHDLKGRQKLKKRIRSQLQRMIGRKPNYYGENDYFRKAIRNNELFYKR